MRVNVYRIRYFLSSEADKLSAESSLLKQIGQAFLDNDLQSAAKLKDYLAAGHWPTQRVTTGPYTDLIAAENQQKAVAALPPVPAGQIRTVDLVHTEIEGAFWRHRHGLLKSDDAARDQMITQVVDRRLGRHEEGVPMEPPMQ